MKAEYLLLTNRARGPHSRILARFWPVKKRSIQFFAVVNVNNPISPKEYQAKIRAGFSTNWFKSKSPQKKYSEQNIIDVHEKGFSNLRLRCRADLYSYNYSAVNFTWFLGNLTTVVDYCLKHDVIPIISWIPHQAEACAMKEDFIAYRRGLVDSGGKAVKKKRTTDWVLIFLQNLEKTLVNETTEVARVFARKPTNTTSGPGMWQKRSGKQEGTTLSEYWFWDLLKNCQGLI